MKSIISVSLLSLSLLPITVMAEVFFAPFAGYSFATSDFSVTESSVSTDEGGDTRQLGIDEAQHWGAKIGVTTTDPGDIYLLYSHQSTKLRSTDNGVTVMTPLSIDYLHLGGSLYFPQEKFRPFVTASAGLAQIRPSGDASNATGLSLGLGGGSDYQLTNNLTIFAELRGYANVIQGSQALYCQNGRCNWRINADIIWQGQLNAGIKYTFY